MRTLTVTLEDLEGVPHGTVAAGTTLSVTARYSREVILTDGTIIPPAIKHADLPGSGVASFEVHESDSTLVDPDYRDFAIMVEATVTDGPRRRGVPFRRTVKVLTTSTPVGGPVPLGSLPAAEGLPAKWVSVADFAGDFARKGDIITYGWRHPRGVTEESGDATYNGSFYGYGLSALVPSTTRFNRLAVRFASTAGPVRVRVYSLASMNAGALVPAGNTTTSLLLADLTLTSGYPTGSTPDEVLIDLGQDVTVDGGRYVVALITTTAAYKITVAKWQTNTPGDRVGLWLVTSAADAISGPGSLPVNGSTPPRLDYVAVPVQAIADQVDAALAPFPAHTYVDLWTSPVFDDGRNVYVTGQPATALTTATAAAAKGATTLTVAATNFVAGMSLVTDATGPNGQVVRIASVAGGTLTLADPLTHPIANAQRLDFLWQNASHLSASSGANFSGYAFLARTVFEAIKEAIPAASKIALLANSWAVQGSVQWSAQAAAKYPGATFVNAGVGGNTTAQMLARFTADVPADSDLIILFEWVNDSYQGVTAGVQAAHWRELVTKALAITPNVVVIGPVPLNEHPTKAVEQESAAATRAGTSLEVLQLRRAVAELQAAINAAAT